MTAIEQWMSTNSYAELASPAPGETAMPELGIPVSGLVECLRKIQKSVPRWSQRGGRQGYLQFVSQYIR